MSEHPGSERRRRALDALRTLRPDDEPGELAKRLEERHGALGSFAIDFALGDVLERPGLAPRDRALATLSMLGAIDAADLIPLHAALILDHLEQVEVDEVVVTLAGYAGFPRALHAMQAVDGMLRGHGGVEEQSPRPPAPPRDDAERQETGLAIFGAMSGRDLSARSADDLERSMGLIGSLAMRWGYGELWARDELSRRDRSLVVVAALTVLGRSDELRIHIPGALRNGLEPAELEELLAQAVVYGGFPVAVEANRVLREVLADWKG